MYSEVFENISIRMYIYIYFVYVNKYIYFYICVFAPLEFQTLKGKIIDRKVMEIAAPPGVASKSSKRQLFPYSTCVRSNQLYSQLVS